MNEHITVGDAIGMAYRVCRKDIKILLGILMLPTVIYTVGKLGMLWGSREYMLLVSNGAPTLEQLQGFLVPALILFLCFFITYSSMFWLMMKELAYVRMIVFDTNDYSESLKFIRKQKWKLLGFMAFVCVAFVFWFSLIGIAVGIIAVLIKVLSLPKIFVAVMSIPLVIVFVLSIFAFFIPVVLYCLIMSMEGQGFFATVKRSVSLSYRNFGKLTGFGVLSYLSMCFVGFALQAPYQLFYLFHYIKSISMGAESYAHSPVLTVPLYLQMLASVWQSVIAMYLYTALFLSAGYVYYSIRMKEDGIDLTSAIDKLAKKNEAY